MNLLPFEKYVFEPKMTVDKAMQQLDLMTEPKQFGLFRQPKYCRYRGTITQSSFKISRSISYRNSFLPVVEGTIRSDFDGSIISMKMRLNYFVLVFVIFWSSGVTLVFLAMLMSAIAKGKFQPAIFVPLGMLLFLSALVIGGFKYESRLVRKDFEELFGKPVR